MNKLLPDHIRETLKINPDAYGAGASRNRLASFSYAIAGLLHVLRYSKNMRIQLLATLVVVAVGLWVRISNVEWAILVLVMALNMFAETVNAAIEAAVNLASPEIHPMARVAKDVAAGSVLMLTAAAIIIGFLLLWPPFWERLT
jgi:diacylglycerol kinase